MNNKEIEGFFNMAKQEVEKRIFHYGGMKKVLPTIKIYVRNWKKRRKEKLACLPWGSSSQVRL